MEFVATLVAGFDSRLAESLITGIARGNRIEWLSDNEAIDIFFEENDVAKLREEISKKLGDETVDLIVQPRSGRRKKMLAADMESTIIEQELLDELASSIGVGAKVSAITQRAMNGELDFVTALRSRVELFKNQPMSLLDKVAALITLTPGAKELVRTMKAHGARTYLITGGFSYFATPLAKALGFDGSFANELPISEGRIEGTIVEPILDRSRKKHLLEDLSQKAGLTLAETLSVGDGANDVPMLSACSVNGGLGIAYQAKPKVRAEIADQINFGDLTALLYAQGYKKSSWTI